MARKFTAQDEDQMVEAYQSGCSLVEIASSLGCSVGTVHTTLMRRGVPRRKAGVRPLFSPEQEVTLVGSYQAGTPMGVLAASMGCSTTKVFDTLRKHGVQSRPPQAPPVAPSPVLRCTCCQLEKERSQFPSKGRQCIQCSKEKARERYSRDASYRERMKEAERLRRLVHPERGRSGWTKVAFEEAWAAQKGCCAICKGEMQKSGKHPNSVNADHDHATGRPRALLCPPCNKGLGNFRDTPAFLLAAVEYLKLYV